MAVFFCVFVALVSCRRNFCVGHTVFIMEQNRIFAAAYQNPTHKHARTNNRERESHQRRLVVARENMGQQRRRRQCVASPRVHFARTIPVPRQKLVVGAVGFSLDSPSLSVWERDDDDDS